MRSSKTSILPNILDIAVQHNLDFSKRSVYNRPEEKRAICPFHVCTTHRQPEYHLYINTMKNTFKCFSCGESGGVVKFIALLEGKTEQQVLDELKGGSEPKRKRKKVHPAETLTAIQLKALGFDRFTGWYQFKKTWSHNPAYVRRTMNWMWREWQDYLQYRLENAYKLLLIGLMTGNYRHAIARIKEESDQLGVDLLAKVLTIYSQRNRPRWTEDIKKLAHMWAQSAKNEMTATTG